MVEIVKQLIKMDKIINAFVDKITVQRHCEGDSPKQSRKTTNNLDCFAPLAMTCYKNTN